MSRGIDRLVDIIQDNAAYESFFVNVSLFLSGKIDRIPVMSVNDGDFTEIMGLIAEKLSEKR